MAGEQSSGTFVPVPGETPELRERSAARVESITELEPAHSPALPETVSATCITVIKEAMDEAIRRGVPADAARAVAHAKRSVFQSDWKRCSNPQR
jgi:hypothetical protein